MNGIGRGEEQTKKDRASVVTRETVGMTFLLFGAVAFFIAVTGKAVFGDVGGAITAWLVGAFGWLVYPLLVLLVYESIVLVFGKKLISVKWTLRGFFLVISVFLIVHTATSERFFVIEGVRQNFGNYLTGCWNAAQGGVSAGTAGGSVLGIFAYPVRYLLQSAAAAYVVYSLLIVVAVYLILRATPLHKYLVFRRREKEDEPRERGEESRGQREERSRRGVAFEDLAAPSPRTIPAQPRAEAQPARAGEAEGEDPAREAYSRSRNILFSDDPAADYRRNLIFDRDSYFNTGRRGSEHSRAEQSRSAPAQPQSYTEKYENEAGEDRPSIPRKVTGGRPQEQGGYAYPRDLNYPDAPSYRQEDPRAYEHDVPYRGETEEPAETPRPSYRAPEPPQEQRPSYRAPEPPQEQRPSYRAPEPPQEERPSYRTPEPPQEERESFRTSSDRNRIHDPAPTDPFGRSRTEEPASADPFGRSRTEEPAPEETRSGESDFRRLFSRPAENAGRLEPTLGRTPPREEPEERDGYREEPRPRDSFREGSRESFLEEPEDTGAFPEETEDGRGTESERPATLDELYSREEKSDADLFDSDEPEESHVRDYPFDQGRRSSERAYREPRETRDTGRMPMPMPSDQPAPAPKPHVYKPYVRPSMNNFRAYDDAVSVSQEEIERNSEIIVDTLAGFRVDAEVVKVTSGAAVTRYYIDIPRNISVSTVIKRDEEIAMRLHARDGVSMFASRENGAISIEVPNAKRATVGLASVMEADEFVNAKPHSLMFAIGKDVEGRNVCGNIPKMTHVLVAGSTNSGKSVCLNAMLISLICKYSPEDLRLILIDPKKVEFTVFDGLPHLMLNEIISDPQKAVTALNWAIKEMERRYTLFEQKTRSGTAVRNIDEYNDAFAEEEGKIPKIVIVVDELADLMSFAKKDIEERIQRLAAKARAAGIHLVLATQRPSVDVITGVIKGNLPTRIAFRVIQEVDSRTILDETGAQKLLGNGDMLYRTGGMFSCLRVQGAFVSSEEVQAIVDEVKRNNEAYFDEDVLDFFNKSESPEEPSEGEGGSVDSGSVEIKALAIVVKLGSASISLIQRRCGVGYARAGKIIEWMEQMGYISPFDGKAKARTVLLTKEEFESKYGSLD